MRTKMQEIYKYKIFSVVLPPDLYNLIKVKASHEHISMAQIVRIACLKYVREHALEQEMTSLRSKMKVYNIK